MIPSIYHTSTQKQHRIKDINNNNSKYVRNKLDACKLIKLKLIFQKLINQVDIFFDQLYGKTFHAKTATSQFVKLNDRPRKLKHLDLFWQVLAVNLINYLAIPVDSN